MAAAAVRDRGTEGERMTFRDRIVSFERVRAGDLVDHPKNWRGEDDPEQDAAILDNLTEIGQVVPLCTYRRSDGKLGVIDGHKRKSFDPEALFWVGITDLDEVEAEKELAALDLLAKRKPQDDMALTSLLADIQRTSGLQGTGYTDDGLDALIQSLADSGPQAPPPEDPGPEEPPAEPVTRPGDVWLCGEHRVVCGDATDGGAYAALLGAERADLLVTSPPYWVGKEYEREKTEADVMQFMADCASLWAARVQENGRIILDTGTSALLRKLAGSSAAEVRLLLDDWLRLLKESGWLLRHLRIWAKAGGLLHTNPDIDLVDQHWEFIATFYKPHKPFVGGRRVGQPWATQGVWDGIHGSAQAEGHIASFPVEIPSRLIALHSDPGQSVLEPFLGAGTTLVAAEQLNRVCYGIEIEPRYVDVSVRRWCKLTGRTAYLESDGTPFPMSE